MVPQAIEAANWEALPSKVSNCCWLGSCIMLAALQGHGWAPDMHGGPCWSALNKQRSLLATPVLHQPTQSFTLCAGLLPQAFHNAEHLLEPTLRPMRLGSLAPTPALQVGRLPWKVSVGEPCCACPAAVVIRRAPNDSSTPLPTLESLRVSFTVTLCCSAVPWGWHSACPRLPWCWARWPPSPGLSGATLQRRLVGVRRRWTFKC